MEKWEMKEEINDAEKKGKKERRRDNIPLMFWMT